MKKLPQKTCLKVSKMTPKMKNQDWLFPNFWTFFAVLEASSPPMGPGTHFGSIFASKFPDFLSIGTHFYILRLLPGSDFHGQLHLLRFIAETLSSAPGAVHHGNHFRPALCCASFLPHFKHTGTCMMLMVGAMSRRRRLQYIYIYIYVCVIRGLCQEHALCQFVCQQ